MHDRLTETVYVSVRVVKFNKLKPPPDVQKEEWNACSSIDSFAQGEVGYRQRSDKVYDFIEKQVPTIVRSVHHTAFCYSKFDERNSLQKYVINTLLLSCLIQEL